AGDNAEERQLARHVGRVQRRRERGLGDPDVAGAILRRLLGLRVDHRVLDVVRAAPGHQLRLRRVRGGGVDAHLRIDVAAGRLERVDAHVAGERAGAVTRIDRQPGDGLRGQADLADAEPGLDGLRLDQRRGHVRRAGDLLLLELAGHGAAAVDAHNDRDDAEDDEDRRCHQATDFQKLAHGALLPSTFVLVGRSLRRLRKRGIVASAHSTCGIPAAPFMTPALDALDQARELFPAVPHVAVFDTAFHRTLPERASTYPLPERFRARGIRRYGFHGLSVAWAVEQVPVSRLVVCHLGGGCSVTAVRDGQSIDTTTGFTPLEGVPMGTRAGSVDPGALLYLLRSGVTLDELDEALEHESGLVGLAGTDDVKALLQSDDPPALLALEIFAYRVAQAVSAMATAIGGIDALA